MLRMTKAEFKRRWMKDESGDGLTFDDVADCAQAWGLFGTPRIHQIDTVKEAVLEAANIPKEEW